MATKSEKQPDGAQKKTRKRRTSGAKRKPPAKREKKLTVEDALVLLEEVESTGEDGQRPLWLRQPWDTDDSYYAFEKYYLAQPRPRRLVEAYRNWAKDRGLVKKANVKRESNQWSLWFRGQNYQAKRPAGSAYENAVGWLDRAAAWDEFLERNERARWMVRSNEVREIEWTLGKALLQRVETMQAAALFRSVREGEDGSVIIEPSKWNEGDMQRGLDLGSKVLRRAVGMEETRSSVKVDDWRQNLTMAGADPDVVYEQAVQMMAAQMAAQDGFEQIEDNGDDAD